MKLKTLLLLIFFFQEGYALPVILCDSSKGLELINQEYYSEAQINLIVTDCDKVTPNDPKVLLLHGLLARKKALHDKNYLQAIEWLEKASHTAPDNLTISQELAATYTLANQLAKALAIYQRILSKDATERTATLGEARIYRLQGQLVEAKAIYQQLLSKEPHDVEALNGLAWVKAAEKNLALAMHFFEESLKIQPNNPDALLGLDQIKQTIAQEQVALQQCNASAGFALLKQTPLPITAIQAILNDCENNKFDTTETQLLHGLLARQQALKTHQYDQAIFWLQKAMNSAATNDKGPAIQLAVTLEWAKQLPKAKTIYNYILAYEPTNKAALLGKGRVLRLEGAYAAATEIYQQLLRDAPQDVDAINGLGRIQLSEENISKATDYFKQTLALQPTNQDALIALQQISAINQNLVSKIASLQMPPTGAPVKSLCDADKGLILLNQPTPNFSEINRILQRCDKNTPNDTSTLMLHALTTRYKARLGNKNYKETIALLHLAIQSAKPDNKTPLVELAITYEWANQPEKALLIYQQMLCTNPDDTIALLGEARNFRALYLIGPSVAIYNKILQKDPNNVDALNGLGETALTNYDFKAARAIFNKSLALHPQNKQALKDLSVLNNSTKNILDLIGGHYAVPPHTSEGANLFYFRNLNATDALTILATHNTKQIESGFLAGPTLLPNNSLLVGYQHQVPKRYGWLVDYDGRQHNGLPFEHRAYGSANVFLNERLQWFNGLRIIVPKPWNTQLYISGVTVYTDLPVNVTLTGYWSHQQLGGNSSSYVLDLSKEYSSHLFYDIGTSYLPRQTSWEVHGRVIIPTLKNQALVADYSHYFFNRSTFATLGWRFYWA